MGSSIGSACQTAHYNLRMNGIHEPLVVKLSSTCRFFPRNPPSLQDPCML